MCCECVFLHNLSVKSELFLFYKIVLLPNTNTQDYSYQHNHPTKTTMQSLEQENEKKARRKEKANEEVTFLYLIAKIS